MNIKIRKWQESDIDNLVRYANNQNISNNLADAFPFPYTREFGLKFIKRVSSEHPTKIFAITSDNKAIGSIGIFPDQDIYRKNGAIAYWVAEPYWGKGIATSAIEKILRYGFDKLGLTRIYAKPFGSNPRSHRVLEKAGFGLEATIPNAVFKNDMYLEERIYGILGKKYSQKQNAEKNNVRLKKAGINDKPIVVDFDYRLDRDEHIKLNREEKITKAISNKECFLILLNKQAVGFVIFDYRFFDRGWIELIVIDEEYRGKGIGVKALNLICEQCKSNKIYTSTNRSNTQMQRALSKANFAFAGELNGLDDGDPELFYFKKLNESKND